MRAMLFAAGLGTRLRPLTNDKPKALVEVQGKPLLDIALEKLVRSGCKLIVVNVHHFAQQVIDRINCRDWGAKVLVSDERDSLLDTGGGLKAAFQFFSDEDTPILLYNVDVLTDLDLSQLYRYHCEHEALATLAVTERSTSRYFLFDANQCLRGWRNISTGEQILCPNAITNLKALAFSGVAVVGTELFEYMPSDRAVFSITEVYLKACCSRAVRGYLHDPSRWLDAGKPAALARAQSLSPWWET